MQSDSEWGMFLQGQSSGSVFGRFRFGSFAGRRFPHPSSLGSRCRSARNSHRFHLRQIDLCHRRRFVRLGRGPRGRRFGDHQPQKSPRHHLVPRRILEQQRGRPATHFATTRTRRPGNEESAQTAVDQPVGYRSFDGNGNAAGHVRLHGSRRWISLVRR